MVAALALLALSRGEVSDAGWMPRSHRWRWLPALVAIAALSRTLALPYFADDYGLLAEYGSRPSPLDVWTPAVGERWFRPVGWLAFWIYGHVAPESAVFAHGVAILTFAICVYLAPVALRRLGVRRDVAFAAAWIYATAPAAFDTVAWCANVYSHFSLLGMLAALVLIGPRASRARVAGALALGFVAALSKEESFVLPALAAWAASRGRWARWRDGLRMGALFVLPFAAAIALRWKLLGGLGGYVVAPGAAPVHLVPPLPQIASLFAEWIPSRAFWILRPFGERRDVWLLLPTAAAFLLLLVGGLKAPSRSLRRALVFMGITLLPTAPVLVPSLEWSGSRHLYVPTLGLAAMTGSLIAGVAGAGAGRRLLLLGVAALGAAFTYLHSTAWTASAQALQKVASHSNTAHLLERIPQGGAALVQGLPGTVCGVPCFGDGKPHALGFLWHRRDVQWHDTVTGFGALDAVFFVAESGEVRMPLAEPPAAVLSRVGDRWRWDSALENRKSVIFTSTAVRDLDHGMAVRGVGEAAAVLFPICELTPGSRLRVAVDGAARWPNGAPQAIPLAATVAGTEHIERLLLPSGTFDVPPGARRIRLELMPVWGLEIELRSLELKVVP